MTRPTRAHASTPRQWSPLFFPGSQSLICIVSSFVPLFSDVNSSSGVSTAAVISQVPVDER